MPNLLSLYLPCRHTLLHHPTDLPSAKRIRCAAEVKGSTLVYQQRIMPLHYYPEVTPTIPEPLPGSDCRRLSRIVLHPVVQVENPRLAQRLRDPCSDRVLLVIPLPLLLHLD